MKTLILGATKGLGKSIASECRNRNWDTIEVGSSIQTQKEEKRTLLQCDFSSPDSVSNLIHNLDELQPIDCLFWVAGRVIKGDFSAHSISEINQTIDVNFRNVIPIVQTLWNKMQKSSNPSKIVVVSSSSGVKARFDEAVYVSTKFAQVGFTRSLGLENKNTNLKVSLILPGGMQTQFYDTYPSKDYDSFLDPNKVAKRIMSFISEQQEKYAELEIPRGSL